MTAVIWTRSKESLSELFENLGRIQDIVWGGGSDKYRLHYLIVSVSVI